MGHEIYTLRAGVFSHTNLQWFESCFSMHQCNGECAIRMFSFMLDKCVDCAGEKALTILYVRQGCWAR